MGPACHIGKAVVSGINSVMLTYGEGHRFGLHLLVISGKLRLQRIHLDCGVNGVKLLVGHFVDRCFHSLHLTHAFLNGDAVLDGVEISLCSACDLLKTHRYRTGLLQCFEEHFILRHIAGQLIYTESGQRFSVGLADVENIDHLERRHQDFLRFLYTGPIRICKDLAGDRIGFLNLHSLFVGSRGKNANAVFAFLHLTPKLLLPGGVSGYQCGIRFLHGDQDRIIQGIIMELGKRLQILLEFVAFKKCLYSGLQLIRDCLYLLKLRRVGFLFCAHKHSSDFFFSETGLGRASASDALSPFAMRFS